MLARVEAHLRRLSSLYSLLSQAQEISAAHLASALALWDVVEASVRAVFSGRTGNSEAERIRGALLPGQSVTLTEIQNVVFRNHVSGERLRDAIQLLMALDEVRVEREPSDGRDAVVVTRRPEGGWAEDGGC